METIIDYNYIALLIPVVSLIWFCLSDQDEENELERLRIENKTLKSIILKSFDRTFTNALKNGYSLSNHDDD
jgi:hypothetical protein